MERSPADILRAARLASGFSAREAARLAGVPASTVTQAERGRDPRHETLQRLVDVLPALSVPDLLGRASEGPPALRGAWRFFAEAFGFEARLVRLTTTARAEGRGPVTLEVLGLRSLRLSVADPAVRESLMQAACEGSGAVMRALEARPEDLRGVPQRHADGEAVHEFSFPRDMARRGFDYRRTSTASVGTGPPWGEPFRAGLSAWIRFPARALEFVIRREAGQPPLVVRPLAWPARVVVEPDAAAATWAGMHPRDPAGPFLLETGGTRFRIACVVPATCVGVGWEPATESDIATLPRAPRLVRAGPASPGGAPAEIGQRIASARERAGLSRRELAQRMGVSAATVIETESGLRQPRLSNLRRLAEALPAMPAHALLLPRDGPGAMTRSEAWRWHRDLHGASSEEEATIIQVAPDGACRYRCRVIGLRLDGRGGHALRLRHGLSATRQGLAAPRLLELHSDVPPEALTTRVVTRETGALLHEIRLGAEIAGRRISYERTLAAGRALPMTWEMSPMFLIASPLLPTRRLRLELRFGAGRLPSRHVAGCSPEPMLVLKEGVEDLAPRLHADGWQVVADRRRGRLALVVDEPLLGLTYALGIWPP